MPHLESSVPAPIIEPLGSEVRGHPACITKTTLIKIHTDNPLHKIYFTTDGTIPDAFSRLVSGREVTHKYKAPFGLKPGARTVSAIAYTRNGKSRSRISSREFEVVYIDTDLSEIGELDEDGLSTVRSSRIRDISSSETDDGGRGSTRYMERLRNHLDQSATSSGSDLDFETPRSIREMLNGVETPHTTRNGRSARNGHGESILNMSEYEQLQQLEEEHQRAAEEANYLRSQGEIHEAEYERVRAREDKLRRDDADEEYHETRERERSLYETHHADLAADERQRHHAWEAQSECPSCRDCNDCNGCDCDDGKSHITDFFSSDNRLSNFGRQQGISQRPLNGSGGLSDRDYGISGTSPSRLHAITSTTTRQTDLPSSYSIQLQQRMNEANIPCTGRCGSGYGPTFDEQIHSEYRRQVDSELNAHMMANGRSINRPLLPDTTPVVCEDCPECRAAITRDSKMYEYKDYGGSRTVMEVDRLFERARRRSRSPSPRRRSRSRDRLPQSIMKRGHSLERARSRERERERSLSRDRDPRGRRDRSRSLSNERRRSLSREPRERRSRSRERRPSRSRSPSPGYRRLQDVATPRDIEHNSRSRSQRGYTNLRDSKMSLEEIDVRLSQLEESDSSVRDRDKDKNRRQKSTKEKKDSANLRKSSKKVPVAAPPSPPSSVSSSLSSSSSSSSEEEPEKKNKKSKPSQSMAIIPKSAKPSVPQKSAEPRRAGKKKAEGALNFFNDSGTQINFWGMSPDEIAAKLQEHPDMREAMAAAVSASGGALGARQNQSNGAPRSRASSSRNGSVRGSVDTSEVESDLDSFFITEPRRGPTIKATRQATAHGANYIDEDGFDGLIEPASMSENQSAPVQAGQQAEQHSFFSKIGDKVKGFFGGGKKKSQGGVTSFTQVNYEEVKKKCRKDKKMWEDPDFPADDSALFYNQAPQLHPFEWKRPHEICKKPQFIVGGASRFDVKQGVLGNCWLLAAVASLAGHEKLLYRVIYPDQSFKQDYAGIFRFQFWQYGEWVDICIDDRLPTKNGKLVYMHSQQEDEFWSPLIEKAYAKLNGCYENLSGGLTSEAMTDFTGGLVECFNFREELPDNMFQILNKANERGSLMGCSIDASPDAMEEQLDNGLIIGHAYSITDVKEVSGNSGTNQLVRVRNPWGNHCEWTGAWSDNSKEWKEIAEKTRKKLGIETSHDGEFWMSVRDFTTHFQRVEVCNQDRSGSGAWESVFISSSWIKNISAGGCRNFPETYATNPQFEVNVQDIDDDDEEDVGTVILALLQKDRRKLRPTGGGNLTIGYDIFQVPSKFSGKLDKKQFKKAGPVATSPQYINQREITGRHRLPVGKYIVVPTSFDHNEEADFLLRIYSEKEAGLMESDVTTSVNTKISAKTMAVAHSAPGQQLKSQEAEQLFIDRSGEDVEVDAYELEGILNSTFTKDFTFGSFNINSCRAMVAMRDTDATGMLGLGEFKSLWADLIMWKEVFRKYDKDENGYFSSFELREALKAVGYNVSNCTFKNMVMRYSDREGHIQFNDFLDCLVKLKTLFELHTRFESEGNSTLPLDAFIASLMYS